MDRMSLLARAASQQLQKQQRTIKKSRTIPIAPKVLVLRHDAILGQTVDEKKAFKAFLMRAHGMGVPVYMFHPDYNWSKLYKALKLTPDERNNLIKGFFHYDDLPDIKEKIVLIEKVPLTRVRYVGSGDRLIQRAQQQLRLSPANPSAHTSA